MIRVCVSSCLLLPQSISAAEGVPFCKWERSRHNPFLWQNINAAIGKPLESLTTLSLSDEVEEGGLFRQLLPDVCYPDSPSRTAMHPDRKIGIAMGILLVGVVAALFFRNEPLPEEGALTVRRERELNDRLKERDIAVYLDAEVGTPDASDDDANSRLEQILADNPPTRSAPTPVRPAGTMVAESTGSVVAASEIPPHLASGDSATRKVDGSTSNSGGSTVGSQDSLRTQKTATPEASSADETAPGESPTREFQEYTVQFGDTLSEIAEKFLGSQTRYREIYEANKDRMASPDQLRVGKAIRIPRVIR